MRRILVLNDFHVGSIWGLWPNGFRLSDGNEITLSPVQEELWAHWNQMKERVGRYDLVILLGDLCNGLGKKEFGKHLMVSDLNEQVGAVISLLKPLCRKKDIVGVSSSGYHTSADYEIDKRITEHFGGDFGGEIANCRIKGTNKVINIAHGGGTSPMYIGTSMTREVLLATMSERLEKIPNVDLILRGHIHEYAHLEVLGKHFVHCPCWEGTRHSKHSMPHYFRFQPTIGVVILEVDEDYINVVPMLFNLKHESKNVRVI